MNSIPLCIPNLAGNEIKYIQECIQSNFVSSIGPFVKRFEDEICKNTHAKYAVTTCSGTTALHVSLVALEVERDSLVIAPSFTFIASANAISHAGAQPWLFDVSNKDWCLDPDLLEEILSSETEQTEKGVIHKSSGKRVSAIMLVYTLGMPADMDKITSIAKKYNLPVISDAAAAIGSTYKNEPLGSIGASLSAFSFNGNKTITCGGGGVVFGNDRSLLEKVKHLCTTARVGQDYSHDMVGFNYRMTNVEAAIGCAQMEVLDKFMEKKRAIHNNYNNSFSKIDGITLFPESDLSQSSCWFSGIVLGKNYNIDFIRKKLRGKGIDSRPFWKPMHLQTMYKDCPKTSQHICESFWNRVLTLPCSTKLKDSEQEFVIKSLINIL